MTVAAEPRRCQSCDRELASYQDEVYSFFQNCFHLKDWLKNDEASRTAAADVEQLIKKSPSL